MPPVLQDLTEATPAIRQVIRRLDTRFGVRIESWGTFVCKRISGSTTPSQHAWGNAIDIAGSRSTLDQVATFARSRAMRPYVSQVLWQVADHYDHVHISGRPYRVGTPPCMTPGGGSEGPGGTGPGPARGAGGRRIPPPAATVAGESSAASVRMAAKRWRSAAGRATHATTIIRRSIQR